MEDKRYEYLKKLINNIFDTLANSYRIDDGDTGIIVRGKGKEICKCTFTEKYRKDYIKLFEITFTYKKCKFEYAGKQKISQKFNRDIAIRNARKYFKKVNIDIDYVFHSQSDKYLFSKLIYKYIEKLLDVIFNDYNCTGEKRNKLISQRYTSILDNIRSELDTKDIYELIYSTAKWADAELLTYNNCDLDKCDSVMLVDFGFEFRSYFLINFINTTIKLIPIENQILYRRSKSTDKFYGFDLINEQKIEHSHDIGYFPIELREIQIEEQYIPRYCCIAFCLSEIKKVISCDEYHIEEYICNELRGEALFLIQKKYIEPKVQCLNYIKQIEKILEILLNINYRKYFDKKEYIPREFKKGFKNFNIFLEKLNLMIDEKNVIFKYLISIWIDDFSDVLFCVDSVYIKSLENETVLKEHRKTIEDYAENDAFEKANELYKVFYKKNQKTINSFKKKVVIKNREYYETSIEVDSGKGFNPYSHLKTAINEYSKKISNLKI